MPRYLDIFAGAGGLSEGFLQEGYTPVAHIEMDEAACYTLKTRLAYKWLCAHDLEHIYETYLSGIIDRSTLYDTVPQEILASVLNYEISNENLQEIFLKIDEQLKGECLDLIVGGPPCQAYSLIGRSRDLNNMVGDKRNYLYILYAEFLRRYRPTCFVFENVTGLLTARDTDGEKYLHKMQRLFEECGYATEYKVLDAKDYGVLQNRKRIILIGCRGANMFYPHIPRVHYNVCVSDIFEDLPILHAGEGEAMLTPTNHYSGRYLYETGIKHYDLEPVTFHCARPHNRQDLKIYKKVVSAWNKEMKRLAYDELPNSLQSQNNDATFLDRFKVVAGNLPYSQTVVAHISKDGHYFIHPDLEQNRSLTPREAARLQTFPDNYYFESASGKPSRTSAFKQIGNAVPVLLARKIARALLEVWE